MEHAGRAVVFSGSTVAISLLALVVLPVPFLRSLGIAGMLIPLVSVAVAMTLLPVVLATIGPRLDRRHTGRTDRASRGWSAWARLVVRHRWAAAIASTAVLAALVFAASTIQLGNPRADSLAQAGSARAGLDQLVDSGVGTGPLSPFDTLVRSGDPEVVAAALRRVEGVRAAVAPKDWRRDGTALVAVIPAHDGNSPEGRATLDRVRAATGELRADAVTGGGGRAERRLPRRRLRQLPARDRADLGADVPPARARVPLARPAAQGRPAEPALGRRRVGPDGARLAARLRIGGDLGHRRDGLDQRRDADRRVRVPVRHLDGLPGVHPQPDARGLRPDRLDRDRRRRGRRPHRAPRDERGADPRSSPSSP